jgi:hypothetical protein
LAGHLNDEQWERAKEIPVISVPILKLLAEIGRAEAHSTPESTTPKGQARMGENMSRDAAVARHRQLTADLHNARARQDRLAAKAIEDERSILAEAIWPGSSAPDANHKQVIG